MSGRAWPWLAAWALLVSHGVGAHGVRAGDLHLDHPYALVQPTDPSSACVYLRGLHNAGDTDVVIGAHTARADRVEWWQDMGGHWMAMGWAWGWVIPAQASVPTRHNADGRSCLRLMGLRAPLRDGERFDLTLNFARQGEVTVRVWVQTPRRP